MARRCKIEKNKDMINLVKKFKSRRDEYRAIIQDQSVSLDEKFIAQAKMQALPRDSSSCRFRNRCLITGRARGVYRRFGLGRNKLRELAMSGMIPGLRKASW